MAVSLVPAFGTLYQRLTLPESTRYIKSTQSPAPSSNEEESFDEKKAHEPNVESPRSSGELAKKVEVPASAVQGSAGHRGHFRGVWVFFYSFIWMKGTEERRGGGGMSDVRADHLCLEFIRYFSEWRHAKILLGTCSCWFLLDIAYVSLFLFHAHTTLNSIVLI